MSGQLQLVTAVRGWPVPQVHYSEPWEQDTDACQHRAWLGGSSLQACSQTACHLEVHVPWLHKQTWAICETIGFLLAWAAAMTLPGNSAGPQAGTQLQEGRGDRSGDHGTTWL